MAEGDAIASDDLPRPVSPRGAPSCELPFAEYKDQVVRQYFERLLSTHQGNITSAAQTAGISRQNLQRYLREYGLR